MHRDVKFCDEFMDLAFFTMIRSLEQADLDKQTATSMGFSFAKIELDSSLKRRLLDLWELRTLGEMTMSELREYLYYSLFAASLLTSPRACQSLAAAKEMHARTVLSFQQFSSIEENKAFMDTTVDQFCKCLMEFSLANPTLAACAHCYLSPKMNNQEFMRTQFRKYCSLFITEALLTPLQEFINLPSFPDEAALSRRLFICSPDLPLLAPWDQLDPNDQSIPFNKKRKVDDE